MSEGPVTDERVGSSWFGLGILGLTAALAALLLGIFLVVKVILELAD